jgi:hypothetical protein
VVLGTATSPASLIWFTNLFDGSPARFYRVVYP